MVSRRLALTYTVVRCLIRLVMRLLTRTSIEGLELLPRAGPGILVSNHIDAIDPGILCGALPRLIAFMSKVENDRGMMRLFLWMTGALTVRRGAADRRAFTLAEQALAQGRLVCIFPEGTRHTDAVLGEGRGGAALLALQSGAPIIPVAITGTPNVFRHGFPWVRIPPVPVTVTIGEPFVLCASGGDRHTQRQQLTGDIMAHIAALLPPERRGRYEWRVASDQ